MSANAASSISPWPPGDGGIAALIRAHDWAATPLGPIGAWPGELRALVELVLASPLVSSIACGPGRLLIYNDAASRLYASKHPAALGKPLRDGFPGSYPLVAPLYDRVFAGEAVHVPAQPLPVGTAGTEVFDAYLAPVRDADGRVGYAHMVGFEISRRLAAEKERDRQARQFRESEARLSLALRAARMGTYVWRSDRRRPVLSEMSAEVLGLIDGGSFSTGEDGFQPIHPEDRAQHRAIFERAGELGEDFRSIYRIVRPRDGRTAWIEERGRGTRDPASGVTSLSGVHWDVTEREEALLRLRQSEARFRQFANASSDVLWIRNAGTMRLEYISPAFETVYGDTFGRLFSGNDLRRWAELLLPEDRRPVMDTMRRVGAGERVASEFRIRRRSDGEVRWIAVTSFPLRDEHGRVRRIAGIYKDATDTKRAVERQQVLVSELQHRSRNLLGVVRSVASKTVGQGSGIESFENRLSALGRAQGLLSRFGSDRVELDALVRTELEAHGDVAPPKVIVDGPKVSLGVEQVQTFALALHELATNAVKYGALKNGTGQLSVTWTVRNGDGAARRLVLDWVESGVPLRPDAVTRQGYGRELIERALTYSLRAETGYVIGQDGVRCRIELPLGYPL